MAARWQVDDEPPKSRRASIVGLLGVGSLPGLLFLGMGAVMAVIALCLAPGARREVLASDGAFGGLTVIRAARICSILSLLIAGVVTICGIALLLFLGFASDQPF